MSKERADLEQRAQEAACVCGHVANVHELTDERCCATEYGARCLCEQFRPDTTPSSPAPTPDASLREECERLASDWRGGIRADKHTTIAAVTMETCADTLEAILARHPAATAEDAPKGGDADVNAHGPERPRVGLYAPGAFASHNDAPVPAPSPAPHDAGEVRVIDTLCVECGHQHARHFGGICVGCPCPWRPIDEAMAADPRIQEAIRKGEEDIAAGRSTVYADKEAFRKAFPTADAGEVSALVANLRALLDTNETTDSPDLRRAAQTPESWATYKWLEPYIAEAAARITDLEAQAQRVREFAPCDYFHDIDGDASPCSISRWKHYAQTRDSHAYTEPDWLTRALETGAKA